MQIECPRCGVRFDTPWSRTDVLRGRAREETSCPSCHGWVYVRRNGRIVDNTEEGHVLREFLAEFEEFQRDKELGLVPPMDYSRLIGDDDSEVGNFRALRALLRKRSR